MRMVVPEWGTVSSSPTNMKRMSVLMSLCAKYSKRARYSVLAFSRWAIGAGSARWRDVLLFRQCVFLSKRYVFRFGRQAFAHFHE